MTTQTNSTPKWIIIYLWLTAVITVGACIAGYFMPDSLLATWPALKAVGALSLAGPLGLFLSRNVATAVVTVFSLVKKNSDMIKIVLILRIFSDGFDFLNGTNGRNTNIPL